MNDDRLDVITQKLDDVLEKLDALIRLRVMQMGEGRSQAEQIWLFAIAGLPPRKIAQFLGTSSNAVRVALSNLRKTKRHRPGQKGESR